MSIDLICLDADDTLWHNETYFRLTYERFAALLASFGTPEALESRLAAAERRNLSLYGYGAKGFTLSMIETALEIAGDGLSREILSELLAAGRDMMRHPVNILPGVETALTDLASRGRLVLVTKGDLFHQESKLAASGLGERFSGIEIVSEKTADTYRRIFARYGVAPERAVMAGNAMRSDVLPALEAGAYAALIPYAVEWAPEADAAPQGQPRYRELATLGALADWIDTIGAAGAYPSKGSRIRIVSSRSGLVESRVTGHSTSSSMCFTYLIAWAGSSPQLRAPRVDSVQPSNVS
jgi:putative hydrolase of the HAD superfamily